ncbi:MAG TPA: HAMP domain-containing sensor histidine kinase [Terriglobales bacterium]|jgi:signal transduction histidine kinase
MTLDTLDPAAVPSASLLPNLRQRVAFLNQSRELALAAMFAAALAARVLGEPVAMTTLVLLGLWFGLAWALARVCAGAWLGIGDYQLHRVEVVYFASEIILITGLAGAAGAAIWLPLLFYLVSILYATMVLPTRPVRWLALGAALCFSGLMLVDALRSRAMEGGQPALARLALLVAVALGGYGLMGVLISQFSRMLNGHALALQSANRKLAAASLELRQHRDHLEDRVRQRTCDLERATEELRGANQELRALNQLKSNFLANVSHELRTPLTSIRSFSEILLDYPDEDVFTRCEFLEIIKSESERLTRLINDVLDLAKIEAGKMEWHTQPVPVAELAREALSVIQLVAANRGLKLINSVPAEVWVSADPDRLRQVLTNLLSNALKFTPSGSIEVGALPLSGAATEQVLFVADTGVGVPEENLERIFEKFHQNGNGLSDKPAGTGLGLSICREILARMGGRIWTGQRARQGSTFYFTLPAVVAESEPALAALAEPPSAFSARA